MQAVGEDIHRGLVVGGENIFSWVFGALYFPTVFFLALQENPVYSRDLDGFRFLDGLTMLFCGPTAPVGKGKSVWG